MSCAATPEMRGCAGDPKTLFRQMRESVGALLGGSGGRLDCADDRLALANAKDRKMCELFPESGQRATHKMNPCSATPLQALSDVPVPASPSFARGSFFCVTPVVG